jgi:hypothetical protein
MEACMKVRILCAIFLLGATSACSDDPTATRGPAQLPQGAAAATDPLSNANRLPASLEQKVRLFQADLESKGYEVARGYWTLWGVEDCKYPLQVLGYCYGNNPTAPYALAIVPQWKDEFADQRMQHALTQARRNMSAIYRLDRQEALVVLAELPPPGKYFGIQTNVFTREAALNTNDPIYQLTSSLDPVLQGILFGAAPDPTRRMMVASIGNSTNNVVIEQRTGQSWQAGQQRFFVITPDDGVAQEMTAALLRAGVASPNDVFTEPVAPALIRVGLDRDADDLITYIRYARPNDNAAGEQWRSQLPLTILRVRDASGTRTPEPFPIPSYDQRTWTLDETVLAGDLQALTNAVRARWNQPAAATLPFFSAFKFLDLVGQHCLGYPNANRGPMDCLGDTQDADYQISQSLRIDDGQVIAAVGTLATETGNATYVSVSVNWFPQLVGVDDLSDTDLTGTAADFAGALQADDRLFYVQYLARDCTGLPNCLEVPRKLVPVGGIIKLIQRNYVNPGSARGPDPAKLLNPVAIVLDGRTRPTIP